MATAQASSSERSTGRRDASECKPLIEAATKDVYRHNAFRITGLPVDATAREIVKHGEKLKVMEELGQGASLHTGVLALKPTLDEIREAIQKLKDPERRLIDEIFWFWPVEVGSSHADPALNAMAKGDINTAYRIWLSQENDATHGAAAMHNIAVMWHVYALDWENYRVTVAVDEERRQKIENYWRESFNRWEKLAVDDRLWTRMAARGRQIDDAPPTTGFVRRMRASLPKALAKINAELALSYAQAGKLELARLHLQFMRETNRDLVNVENIAGLVLTAVKTRLKEQIKRAKPKAAQNPADAAEAVRELLVEARRSSFLFDLFFGEGTHSQKEVFDEVANECVNYLVAHQRATGDNKTFVALLQQALLIAQSIDVRRRIEENIAIGEGNLDREEEKLAQVDIAGTLLVVTRKDIQFGSQRLMAQEVVGIRYGIFKQYTNGIRTSRSYAIWLTSGRDDLEIECARGWLVKEATIDQRFTSVVKALWEAVESRLIGEMLESLEGGLGFVVGDLSFDKQGIHRRQPINPIRRGAFSILSSVAGGNSAEERVDAYQHLLWQEYGGHTVHEGAITLFRKGRPTGWASLNLRNVWNAVCLISLFKYLYEEGRLWKIVGTQAVKPPPPTPPVIALYQAANGTQAVKPSPPTPNDLQETLEQQRTDPAVHDERDKLAIECAENKRKRKRKIGWLLVGAVVVALVIIWNLNSNNGGPSSTSSGPSATPSAPSTYSPPPAYDRSELERDRQSIEAERARLQSLKASLHTLGQEIDRERPLVDNSSGVDVDLFNIKVNRYNTMGVEYRARVQAFNARVEAYNEKR